MVEETARKMIADSSRAKMIISWRKESETGHLKFSRSEKCPDYIALRWGYHNDENYHFLFHLVFLG